jgi:integrase
MPENANLPARLGDLPAIGQRAADFARSARSPATLRAYEWDWADFVAWCDALDLASLPAEPTTVGAYLSDRAGKLKVATLERRRAAIAFYHRRAGHGFDNEHLAIASVMSGIRRTLGSRQDGKAAILTEDLRAMVRTLPDTLRGVRDRAVLLIGFGGAFRRSELVALDREDCQISSGGIVITVRKSKTDQEGRGREVGIPRSKRTCPVAALEHWLRMAGIEDGPVFCAVVHNTKPGARLAGKAVADIVKAAAKAAGYDPAKYGAHSLRSGFATSAARAGADIAHIMQQTGHKSVDVARRYVRRGNLFENPASKAVRL